MVSSQEHEHARTLCHVQSSKRKSKKKKKEVVEMKEEGKVHDIGNN